MITHGKWHKISESAPVAFTLTMADCQSNEQICFIFKNNPLVHDIKANNTTYTREQWEDGQYEDIL